MLTLLGVGHVFNLGPRIREEIVRRMPAIVCLELDEARLQALQARERRGGGPALYTFLAHLQRRVAASYGSEVGEEMLAAYQTAGELSIPVALIDMDSSVTWQRLRASMRPSEVLRLVLSSLGALFIRRERIEREMDRYQQDSVGFIEAVGQQYPSVKRIVVDERNEHMARRLRELHEEHGSIVAVVGDGHVEGLKGLLGDLPLETVRLWDLRSFNQ